MSNKFKFSDALSLRMIQIFQEAVMTGVDGADLFRQVEVTTDPNDSSRLVMTEEYKELVKKGHEQLLARADELARQSVRDNEFSDLLGD